MEEIFSFNPSPKKEDDKVSYKKKDIEEWGWKDFQVYFEDQYRVKLGLIPPALAIADYGKRKTMIETSVAHWGKPLFQKMIDWMLDYRTVENWERIDMSLVCGKHYWANYIAEKAQTTKKVNILVIDEEEE